MRGQSRGFEDPACKTGRVDMELPNRWVWGREKRDCAVGISPASECRTLHSRSEGWVGAADSRQEIFCNYLQDMQNRAG